MCTWKKCTVKKYITEQSLQENKEQLIQKVLSVRNALSHVMTNVQMYAQYQIDLWQTYYRTNKDGITVVQ